MIDASVIMLPQFSASWWSLAGLALFAAGLDNVVLIVAYDLAFASPIERLLSWVFWSSTQGLATFALAAVSGSTLVASINIASVWLPRCPRPNRSDAAHAGLLLTVALYAIYWMNSFLVEGPRAFVWRLDLVVLGMAALVTVVVILRRASQRNEPQPFATGHGRTWVFLVSVALAGLAAFMAEIALTSDGAALAGRPGATSGVQPTGLSRANVVLIVIDTMRADRLSYLGHVRPTTPNLDRLAAASIVFRKTWASATQTSPAMASLLTGLSPLTHGIVETQTTLPTGVPTLAEALARLGYTNTAFVGNPNLGRRFGFTRGFHDVEESFRRSPRADQMVNQARRWLAEPRKEPFFLWLHVIDPHTPYTPPPPYDRMFCDDALYRAQVGTRLRPGSVLGGWARLEGKGELADYVCSYDGEVRFTDEHLGPLLQDLEKRRFLGRTLTVVTADHGESLGEHGYFFTHGLQAYDELSRVPLIFSHPALGNGIVDAPARHIDVAASILSLVTGTPTSFGEGSALFPVATSQTSREAVVVSGTPRFRTLAITDGIWKLVLRPRPWRDADISAQAKLRLWPGPYRGIRLRHRSYSSELYDLQTDPGELRNRAGDEHGHLRRLLKALLDWVDRSPGVTLRSLSPEELDEEQIRALKALGYL